MLCVNLMIASSEILGPELISGLRNTRAAHQEVVVGAAAEAEALEGEDCGDNDSRRRSSSLPHLFHLICFVVHSGINYDVWSWLFPYGFGSDLYVQRERAIFRVVLILYGEWQDEHLEVRYTDVDYFIFSDATALMASGKLPYERLMYRYLPLIAFLLMPNSILHHRGKVHLFSIRNSELIGAHAREDFTGSSLTCFSGFPHVNSPRSS